MLSFLCRPLEADFLAYPLPFSAVLELLNANTTYAPVQSPEPSITCPLSLNRRQKHKQSQKTQ